MALGSLDIEGAFTQSTGGSFEINLSSPENFNRLSVTGQATLAGSIKVTLDESFTPVAGTSFVILAAAGGIVGDFSNYVLPELPGALTWNALLTANSVTLAIATPLAADFKGDGFVDAEDLAAWATDFGPVTSAAVDADNDGDSDGADFLAWQRQLGSNPTVAATAVPEPGAFLLFIMASGGLRRTAGRRHKELINE